MAAKKPRQEQERALYSREILFYGQNTNSNGQEETYQFSVLANTAGITVTEGYAKYAHVPRPQRKELTVLEGYAPMTIVVPILFDSTLELEHRNVEEEIQILEWMGGRGVKFRSQQDGGVGTPGEGNSPLVQISAVQDPSGAQSPLVPLQFQTATLNWVVTGIEWDKTPIRGTNGYRIRQAAEVTLTEYVAPEFDLGNNSAVDRQKARDKKKGVKTVTVPVDGKYNTLREIASFYCYNANAVSSLVAENRSNRRIGSNPSKQLAHGVKVKVPQSVVRPKPSR